MVKEIKCKKCGHNEFKKASMQSCSAVPPIFRCVKCEMSQNIPRTYSKEAVDFLPINDKDEHFMGHLKCYVCGEVNLEEFELDKLPAGWHISINFIPDPDGNPMVRHYAYCPNHRVK